MFETCYPTPFIFTCIYLYLYIIITISAIIQEQNEIMKISDGIFGILLPLLIIWVIINFESVFLMGFVNLFWIKVLLILFFGFFTWYQYIMYEDIMTKKSNINFTIAFPFISIFIWLIIIGIA